jgi:hypothetical protein
MLSPFDPIYLVPTYLFAQFYCAESSDYLWHWKWSGSLKQIMGVLVATLSSVSGYVLALRQDASGCVWWQHWALSLAMFWHWGKMHLVAFQHKAEMVSQLSCVIFVLMSTSRHSWWRRCLVPPRGGGLKCNYHQTESLAVCQWNWPCKDCYTIFPGWMNSIHRIATLSSVPGHILALG